MAEKLQVQTKSENTIKAYELLRENGGEMTYGEIASELELKTANILGGITSLRKKGAVLDGEDKEVEGKTYKTVVINPEIVVEFEKMEAGASNKMSEKSVQVLQFFQKEGADAEFTAAEVADKLGWEKPIAVNGVVNGLVKRGLVEREPVIVEMPDGAEKEVKVIKLTDEGVAYKF